MPKGKAYTTLEDRKLLEWLSTTASAGTDTMIAFHEVASFLAQSGVSPLKTTRSWKSVKLCLEYLTKSAKCMS